MREGVTVGRRRELAALDGLVAGADRHGTGILLTGMAGIGKSKLLDEAGRLAEQRGMAVLSTAGTTAEADLPFSGLHRLVQGLIPSARHLPPPQRQAVEVAFGLSEGPSPEPFLIALGILELLGDAAARTPMLIRVEDAQWLDRPTADVLAFVARRLAADPIVLVAALREGYDSPLQQAGLSELHLEPLSGQASEELIELARPGLPPATRARVLAEAEGNPLALRELVDAQTLLPLTRGLEQAFASRAAELPGPARTLTLVAATAEDASLGTILAAAERIDGSPRTIEDFVPAVRARLLEVEDQGVRFRHPLMRSAVHQAATVAEQHATHAALAELYDDDPDRRVWHRWAAAVGPDPAIAAEAEEAGRRAMRRGAVSTAAMAFERAAGMATTTEQRGGLLLQAAAAASELGDGDTVLRLLGEAGGLRLGLVHQAQSMALEDAFRAGPAGDPPRVLELVVAMASRVADLGEGDLALTLLTAASVRCLWAGLGAEAHAVQSAADRIGAGSGDQRLLYIQMCTAPIERGAAVLTEVGRTPTPPDAVGLCLRGMAVCRAGAFDEGVPLLDAAARQLRSQGRLRLLAQVLSIQAWAALELGDLTLAVPAADEAVRLAVETQGPFWRIGALIAQSAVAAFRGDETAVEALTAEADRVSVPAGAAYLVSLAQYARGVLELGRGRHAEAYEHLRRIRTPADAAYNRLCAIDSAGDFVEAAVRAGHQAEAETYLRECEVMADEARSRWVEVQLLVGRMQLADDESSFDEALSRDLSRWPMMRARIVLAHGEWLRRQRRAIESRRPLRAARDAFDAIGAVSWAERTRRELRAAGEGSRERPVDSLDELTPQEFQIVRMAAEGLSNSDIAARLLLSRRTIESHLYRAYPKLGVVSRAQIATALGRRAATT